MRSAINGSARPVPGARSNFRLRGIGGTTLEIHRGKCKAWRNRLAFQATVSYLLLTIEDYGPGERFPYSGVVEGS